MQKQVWRNVPGYEGLYQVSNQGNVRSLYSNDIQELQKINHSKGYLIVNLMKEKKRKTIKIHQLVAMAFLNHVPNGNTLVVDHINHDKKDNRLSNLQILTNCENVRKRLNKSSYSSIYQGVTYFKQTGRWKAQFQYKKVRKHLGYFDTEYEAHLAYQSALNSAAI